LTKGSAAEHIPQLLAYTLPPLHDGHLLSGKAIATMEYTI
jgi:hypothetical protein